MIAVLVTACNATSEPSPPTSATLPQPEAVDDESQSESDTQQPEPLAATALPGIVPNAASGVSLIAFASDFGNGDFEIFVIEPSGQNLSQLTDNDALDLAPAWSPDATRIAFHSDRGGNEEIYVTLADGREQMRLTNNPAADTFPTWSPDGTRIAFVSNRGGKADMWLMNADGSNPIQLTDTTGDLANPDWSPDGTRIAYTRFRPGQGIGDVRVIAVDVPATAGDVAQAAFNPDWSPDGQIVAYSAQRDGLNIFISQSNGNNPTALTVDPAPQHSPSFSPDGAQLIFVQTDGTTSDLWLMNADGSGAQQITQGLNPLMPRWSP